VCCKPRLYPSYSLFLTLKRKTRLLPWYYFLFICLLFVRCFLCIKISFIISTISSFSYCFQVFFPHRLSSFSLSSFRNKRHILYPNYTLSFTKLWCECAIVVLFPKYSFLIVYSIPIRKSHSEPSFSLLFVFFHSETGVTSFLSVPRTG
jgi:hypothetical protein